MKKIYLILILCLIFSCNKEEKVYNDIQNKDDIEVEIVSVSSNVPLTNLLKKDEKYLLKFFTKKEIEKFEKHNIDPFKVKELLIGAKKGNKDFINDLVYIYYITENFESLNKILKIGEKYNVKEAIYNLALTEIKNKNYKKALEYFDKLPKNYKVNEIKEIKGLMYFEKAMQLYKEKKYENSLDYFLNANKYGIKNLEIYIANIYNLKKDEINFEKWLNIAADQGNIEAIRDLAFYYSENNKSEKAIKYFELLYSKGYLEYVVNIYLEYFKLSKIEETIKWYKLGKSIGIIDKNEKIEMLMKYY